MDCSSVKVPLSYIAHDIAVAREALYLNGKRQVLTNYLGTLHPGATEEPLWMFTARDFLYYLRLLDETPDADGIRVYFASYDPGGPGAAQHMPAGKDDRLALIFAPTSYGGKNYMGHDTHNDIVYYMINSANPGVPVHSIEKPLASAWVKSYQTNKMGILNQDGRRTKPDFNETRSLWYPKTDVTDWINIIECAEVLGMPAIGGVTVSPSVYQLSENFAYQLGIILTLFDENKQKINPEYYPKFVQQYQLRVKDDYDTGSPCPPDPNACGGFGLPTP